jgi:hypothetical protein
MNRKFILYVVLVTIFLYSTNVNGQSKDETQEYINITFNSLGLFKRYFSESGYKDIDVSISFYKEYFIVNKLDEKNQDGKYTKSNHINVIQIKDINEIEIERSEDPEKKLYNLLTPLKEEKIQYLKDGYIFINRHSSKKPYSFENIEVEELKKIIDTNRLSFYNNGTTLSFISIRFWDVENEEKLIKLKKSLSHLVELFGGKILNDLF